MNFRTGHRRNELSRVRFPTNLSSTIAKKKNGDCVAILDYDPLAPSRSATQASHLGYKSAYNFHVVRSAVADSKKSMLPCSINCLYTCIESRLQPAHPSPQPHRHRLRKVHSFVASITFSPATCTAPSLIFRIASPFETARALLSPAAEPIYAGRDRRYELPACRPALHARRTAS